MSQAYTELARLVTTQIPVTTSSFDSPLVVDATGLSLNPSRLRPGEKGAFFRVWFHGDRAPDDLVGEEFVYRTECGDIER